MTALTGTAQTGTTHLGAAASPKSREIGGATFVSVELDEDQNGEINDETQRGYHIFRFDEGRGYITLFGPNTQALAKAVQDEILDGFASDPTRLRPGRIRLEADAEDLVAFVEEFGAERLFNEPVGYLEHVSGNTIPNLPMH